MAERNEDFGSRVSHTFAAAASEDVLAGGRLLRRAFLEAVAHFVERDTSIISANERDPPALMIQRGVAFSSHTMSDGRRAIIDLLLPMNIVGIEHAVVGQPSRDIVAASSLGYRKLSANKLRQLIADPQVAAWMLASMAETRRRADRLVTAPSRLDAYERMACFLLSVYDRLRRAELIAHPTFNLHLTQEQIGDHLGLTTVHVSRTLRRLRQDKVTVVDRQVVIILDVYRLRAIAAGLLPATGVTNRVDETDDIRVAAGAASRWPQWSSSVEKRMCARSGANPRRDGP